MGGADGVGGGAGLAQHRADALDRGLRRTPQGERLRHAGERPLELRVREQEAADLADGDRAMAVAPHARRHDRGEGDVAVELLLHVLLMAADVALVALAPDQGDLLAELARDLLLHRMQLDCAVAAELVGDRAGDDPLHLLVVEVELAVAPPGTLHQRHLAAHGRAQDEGQRPVPQHDQGHRRDDVHDRPGHRHRGMLIELHHAGHRGAEQVAEQLAGGAFDVEAQAQVVHLAEEALAQRRQHPFAHPGEDAVADMPHQHPPDGGDHDVDQAELGHPPPQVRLRQVGRQRACARLQHPVDQPDADEDLEGDRQAVHGVERHRRREVPAVRAQQRPDDRPHRGRRLGGGSGGEAR